MTEQNQLLLIVFLPKAQEQLEEKSWFVGLEDELCAVGNIRLYHLPHKKDKEKIAVALPFGHGKVLLLKKDDSRNARDYFICTGVTELNNPPDAPAYYYELPGNVTPWPLMSGGDVRLYLSRAVCCGTIDREVKNRTAWDPYKGAGPAGGKWKAYLDLFENMLNGNRFGLSVKDPKLRDKTAEISPDLSAISDNESEIKEKIKKARGEFVSFSMTPDAMWSPDKQYGRGKFGTLEKSDGKSITIVLDKDFRTSLKEQIKRGEFYAPAAVAANGGVSGGGEKTVQLTRMGKFLDTVKPRKGGQDAENDDSGAGEEEDAVPLPFQYVQSAGQRETVFYYDEIGETPAFSCRAEKKESVWLIDPDSIKPRRLMVFAEFVGDFYQINVMQRGLQEIKKHPIWPVLSGERIADQPKVEDMEWSADCRLNDGQKDAVRKAMGAPELCLIWGPPGTGKTEVISEIARREARNGRKVLISSQANLAVDNALSRLHGADDVWAFRQIKESHDLEKEDEAKVPTRKTAHRFFAQWLKCRIDASNSTDSVVDGLRKKLAKRLEKPAWHEKDAEQMAALYRKHINVVGATLIETGKWNRAANRKNLLHVAGIGAFHTVIIDEVSKALPPELFLPVLLGRSVVLVGDHKQLPPTLKMPNGEDDKALDEWAEMAGVPIPKEELDATIFQELWDKHSGEAGGARAMLTKQYRMHPRIQGIIEPFYADSDGRLECGLSKEQQQDMAVAHEGCFAGRHAVWVDTEFHASMETRVGTSYMNNDEIRIIDKILDNLPRSDDISVGVITFYGAQLRRLRAAYESKYARKFPDGKLIFGTVDRFQGRECDVIICSLVRKNKYGGVGFAVKPNRMNVAFSRARKLLCIVGNRRQFCEECKDEDARKNYEEIFQKCDKMHEGEIDG